MDPNTICRILLIKITRVHSFKTYVMNQGLLCGKKDDWMQG